MGLSKKLLTPTVTAAVVKKVNQKRITNSKELRKLRVILRDPVARDHFLTEAGDIDSAMLRLTPAMKHEKGKTGLATELDAAVTALKNVPWTALDELRKDPELMARIDEAEALLRSLRKSLGR